MISLGDHKQYEISVHPSTVEVSRSGPDMRLTELEQQLEVAETRCGSLKSQLDYMKMLYQGVHHSPQDFTITPNCSQAQTNAILQTTPSESVPHAEETVEGNTGTEEVQYYKFLKEIQKIQEMDREDTVEPLMKSPQQATKLLSVSPRVADRPYVVLEPQEEDVRAEYRHTKQKKYKNKTYALLEPAPSPAPVPSLIHQGQEICKEHDIDDATAMEHPYQQHLKEYSRGFQEDMVNARELITSPIEENRVESTNQLSSESKKEVAKHELALKLSGSTDSVRIIRRKKSGKPDRKQRATAYSAPACKGPTNVKIDDTSSVASKIRRKRGKLRSTHSKSTVATKDTGLTDRKESKKRKQKGVSIASSTQIPSRARVAASKRTQQNCGDVVEIYHNKAIEGGSGSISMTSSKHSKPEPQTRESRNSHKAKKKNHLKQMEDTDSTRQHGKQVVQQQQMPLQKQEAMQGQATTGSLDQAACAQVHTYPVGQNRAIGSYQAQYGAVPSPTCYYDPTVIRNYELPTMASKLKRVNRSYFNRFNFRNIPFVVGTSLSPSHNLGLNIQQVLSIMKTRQAMPSGISSLLIRKVSKGMKPVSTLLEQMNERYQRFPKGQSQSLGLECNEPHAGSNIYDRQPTTMDELSSKMCGGYWQASKFINNVPNAQTQFVKQQALTNGNDENSQEFEYDEEEDTLSKRHWKQQQKSDCTCCPEQSKSCNKMLKQFTSRKSIVGNPKLTQSTLLKQRQKELTIGDGQNNRNHSILDNSNGVREVLINLHDQFEQLNATYEKLQEQAEETNDKALNKQIAALEKELNAKEVEINAVVGLYKEVMSLKYQMKTLHERNSFVCVTTNEESMSPVMSPSPMPMRAQTANPAKMFRSRKGHNLSLREPSTSTRLAALLRQIQTYQKQLQLSS